MRLAVSAAICALALASGAPPAAAQSAAPCDWRATAQALVEPWDRFTRTFADGEVRIALLDVIEPAAGALYLLVLSPPRGEQGERQCRTIGSAEGFGFSDLDFRTLQSSYDPTRGLTFSLAVSVFDGATGNTRDTTLVFTLNQSTGDIEAGYK